jgi:AraC-like DNA-binding protein
MDVSVLMVRALAGVIERSGASSERFLALAGIERSALEDREARMPFADYLRSVDAAYAVSGDPALGLHMGEQARSVMFDVVGPLTEQSPTLRQGIEMMGRYSRLLADGHAPELLEAGEVAAIRVAALRGDAAVVRLTAEFTMTALLQLLELFAGHQATPTRVCFAYDAPPYLAEYRRIFGDTARFGQAFTELELPSAWLDRAQLYQNPELYSLLQSQAERSLDRLERDALLSARIKRILESHDPRQISMDDVARELEISARSLRRRLLAEGVSFRELVDDNRMQLAKRMLERPHASIQETAYALGFTSPAAFHRAFKRWTGMTPQQYRASF